MEYESPHRRRSKKADIGIAFAVATVSAIVADLVVKLL